MEAIVLLSVRCVFYEILHVDNMIHLAGVTSDAVYQELCTAFTEK